jgi:hypothetical protein
MLFDILHTTYRTEVKVDSLRERVSRIEDREHSRSITGHREPRQTWSPRDYLLTAAGIALVTAAALDKVPWSVVQSFVSALK